jgi:hypothetical protein
MQWESTTSVPTSAQACHQDLYSRSYRSFSSFQTQEIHEKVGPTLFSPIKELLKLLLGILRSVLFGAGYFCTYKRFSCLLFGHAKYNNSKIELIKYRFPFRLLWEDCHYCSNQQVGRLKSLYSQCTSVWRSHTTWEPEERCQWDSPLEIAWSQPLHFVWFATTISITRV